MTEVGERCGITEREVAHSEELGATLCGDCFAARADGALLRARLEAVRHFLERFLDMSRAGLDVLAVWVLHTWLFEAAETTPYVSVRSPERESGKTRVIEVVVLVARNREQVADASISALLRAIEKFQSALLLDEVDGIFSGLDEDSKELRRLLNAGYRKGATVLRTVGEKHEPKRFRTFSPKLLAGIGGLPDTLESRCIPIPMQRKQRYLHHKPRREDAAKIAEAFEFDEGPAETPTGNPTTSPGRAL